MGRFVDLTGRVFGHLTVLERVPGKSKGARWKVECHCPSPTCRKIVEMDSSSLSRRERGSSSCGARTENLTGQVFKQLTVIKYLGQGKRSFGMWLCRCSCGNEKSIASGDLKSGQISCGCASRNPEPGWFNYLQNYKLGAQKRGYEWSVSDEYVKFIAQQRCYYCGGPPTARTAARDARIREARRDNHRTRAEEDTSYVVHANGIDRIDNTRGYYNDNILPCCSTCNWMKADMPAKEFIAHVGRVASRFKDPAAT